MSSDDDKNFADACAMVGKWTVRALAAVVIIGGPAILIILLTGCDNGESRRQQTERIEKQIGKIELQRERGR